MARRLCPYKHCGTVMRPRSGVIPLTAGEDVTTRIWSYTEAKHREYHVAVVRMSDNDILTHVVFRVRR